MASIRREIHVAVAADRAWDALRDVGRLHERVVKGFVTDCRLEGDTRVVTFANGMTVRERIVDVDDAQRRVVWAVAEAPFEHYNASVQAFDEGGDRTRLVWIADLLPHALAERVASMIDEGMGAMKQTLEGAGAAGGSA
jgi:carbon monoxide dehydrogenase subunit G